MSSPVQECSLMENVNGNGDAKLNKSQKKNRRKALKKKLNANLDKREDTEIPESKPEVQIYTISLSSIQDNPNFGTGTSETGDENMAMISSAATGDEKSLSFKGKDNTKVAYGKMGLSVTTHLNGDVKVQKKMETMIGETSSGTCAMDNTSPKKRISKRKRKQPTLAQILNPQCLQNLEADKGETGSGTTSIDDPASKKRKSEKMKNFKTGLDAILSTRESTQEGLSSTKVIEVKSGEAVLAKPASPDANMVSKGHHTEVANGKMGENGTTNLNVNGKKKSKNKQSTLGESLNLQNFQNLETAKGETGSGTTSTHNPALKKQEGHNVNRNLDLGDNESTKEVINTTKVLEVKNGETVLDKTATSDANLVSKGEDHTEVVNGKIKESETTSYNVNGKEIKRKPPTLAELLNPQCLQNMETTSRKRKRQKLNKNPDLGDILSIPEGVQEGLTTNKVLEVQSGETVSGKTETSNANMVLEGVDHTEGATGKMQENETNNLNVNGKKKKRKKPKSKNKEPTLDESLNPHYLNNLEAAEDETGSGTTATNNLESKKQKRQEINYNPASGDILSTCENTQDKAIAKKYLSTNKVLEAVSGEKVSRGEEHMNDAGDSEMGFTTIVLKSAEPADLEIVKAKAESALRRKTQTLWVKEINYNPAVGDMLSTCESPQGKAIAKKDVSTSKVLESVSDEKVPQGEEHMNDAANSEMGSTTIVLKSAEPADLEIFKAKSASVRKAPTLWVKENTLDKAITKKDLSTSLVLEAVSGEKVSRGEEHMKDAANSEMGSATFAPKSAEPADLKIVKRKSALARKAQTLWVKENTQNKAIAKNDSSTSMVLEAVSCEKVPRGEEHMKDTDNSEMGSTTILLKSAEPAELEIVKAKAKGALNRKVQTLRIKEITQVLTSGKKLLIFDVNGLLADVISQPKGIKADGYLSGGRAIFRRPYLNDFLCFCFERFNVGIWSSRKMKNLRPAINFLLGGLKMKLLFLWDGSKCTNSGLETLDVKHKRVVVKDLRKVWDTDGPCNRWVKGTFHESNTLLVDDSPYKALLNPKHTGIFPVSYSYKNRDDNFLGPKGELQTYLEGLAAADDVKTYVEQHPFGQSAIDEQSPDWAFYSHVLKRLNTQSV